MTETREELYKAMDFHQKKLWTIEDDEPDSAHGKAAHKDWWRRLQEATAELKAIDRKLNA